MPDNDTTAADTKGIRGQIAQYMAAASSAHITLYVAEVPAGGGKDIDEYISNGGDLSALMAGKCYAWRYIAQRQAAAYMAATTDTDREQARAGMVAAASALSIDDQQAAVGVFSGITGTGAALSELMEYRRQQQAEERRKRALKQLHDTTGENNTADSVASAIRGYIEATEADGGERTTFGSMADLYGYMYRDERRNIVLDFALTDNDGKSNSLILPAGGITVVAAGTGSGKTTFTQNIAYRCIEQGRRVAYYSLEEDAKSTMGELSIIDTFRHIANQRCTLLSTHEGNASAINRVFGMVAGGMDTAEAVSKVFDNLTADQQATAAGAIERFARRIIDDRALLIFDAKRNAEQVEQHARQVVGTDKPDIICIDYAQYMAEGMANGTTADEMQHVMKCIIRLAKQAQVPVVLAAQLREKNNTKAEGMANPFDLSLTDVFGNSAIGQGAAQLIVLASGRRYASGSKAECMAGSIEFGGTSRLAVKLDKNRSGMAPQFGVFEWPAGRRYIEADNLLNRTIEITLTDNNQLSF